MQENLESIDPHMDHLHVTNMKKVCECFFKCYDQKLSTIDRLQGCLSICESTTDGDKITFDTEFS